MKRILYLSISAVLTAFTLVVVGGVAGAYAAQAPMETPVVDVLPFTVDSSPTPEPTPTAQPTVELATPTPEPEFPISARMAALIAMAAAPNATLLGEPVLVEFEGRIAYEVQTDQGLIYIDANEGSVLFNGTIPVQIVLTEPAPASPSDGGSFRDDEPGEHEEEDEDD